MEGAQGIKGNNDGGGYGKKSLNAFEYEKPKESKKQQLERPAAQ